MKRIQLRTVLMLMRQKQSLQMPFDITFIKKNGAIVEAKNVVQTSSNFKRRTRNIRFVDSDEIRKVRNISIIKFNGIEVYV